MTQITYINHASLLIESGGEFLLLDPWFETPAFGSWLPLYPSAIHPVYLAALPRLSLLISHGHDDHCDDRFVQLFDRDRRIISSDFASPSVERRVRGLGFENFLAADKAGVQVGPFFIRSIRNEEVSQDDAIYTIRTPDGLVIHCNDNWNAHTPEIRALLAEEIEHAGSTRTIYCSQTNSASGFPLSYRNVRSDPAAMLAKKVRGMVAQGLTNCSGLGVPHFLSYAGFALPFVKGREDYITNSIFPSTGYLQADEDLTVPDGVEFLDLMPGDSFDFEEIRRSPVSGAYTDENLKAKAAEYYHLYGRVQECDSYKAVDVQVDPSLQRRQLQWFCEQWDQFVRTKVARDGFSATALGKSFEFIVEGVDEPMRIRFGSGVVASQAEPPNKRMFVNPGVLQLMLDGSSLFENLYTCYGAEFERYPADEYNRDIVMYIVMFSYVYKNRLAPKRPMLSQALEPAATQVA